MSKQKVWFITGASKGMGLEITKAVLRKGGNVIATSRNTETLLEKFVMHHLKGKAHSRTFSTSLEASFQPDNPVRIIDALADALFLRRDGQAGQASELLWEITCLAPLD